MEMLAVVAIIGILVAAATPQITDMMRERRLNAETMTIGEIYRYARARAIGRGAATLVRYDGASWTIIEATTGGGSAIPVSSCVGTNFATVGRQVQAFGVPQAASGISIVHATDNGAETARTFSDICFTPRGRTWIRYAASDNFGFMDGVALYRTVRSDASFRRTRTVFIPPNGATRLQL